MAGLQTQGFQLQALPPLPVIPDNVGKIDVKAIYDRVLQGLEVGQALDTDLSRTPAEKAKLDTQRSIALAQQAVLPSQTQSDIAKNTVLAAQNNPDVAALSGQTATQGARNVLAQQTNDAKELDLLKSLTTQQYAAYKQIHGFGKVSSQTATRDPATGAVSESSAQGINVPGAAPIITDQSTSTGTAPYALAGGLGTLVDNGKGGQTVVHTPPAIMNNVIGTEPVFAGTTTGPDGIAKDEYLVMEYNAQGGSRPGPKISQDAGLPPPSATGNRAFSAPLSPTAPQSGTASSPVNSIAPAKIRDQILSDNRTQAISGKVNAGLQAKARQDALTSLGDERMASDSALGNLAQLDKVIAEYNSGAVVPNAVRGHATVLPEVQKFNGAISQFVSDIVGKLKGTGRVALPEFQFSQAAYPFSTDAESVQLAKANYLKSVAQTASQRINLMKQLVEGGSTMTDAQFSASKAFPLPAPVGPIPTPVLSATPPAQATPVAQPSSANAAPPTITSQQQYDALGNGLPYLDAQGTPHVKGGPHG